MLLHTNALCYHIGKLFEISYITTKRSTNIPIHFVKTNSQLNPINAIMYPYIGYVKNIKEEGL